MSPSSMIMASANGPHDMVAAVGSSRLGARSTNAIEPGSGVTLTASRDAADGVTLTIGNHTGLWYHKFTAPTDGSCSSAVRSRSTNVSNLTNGTRYTFQAYSDENCTTELATSNAFTVPNASFDTVTASSASASSTDDIIFTNFGGDPLTSTTITVTEGKRGRYFVKLSASPGGTMTVTASSDNNDVKLAKTRQQLSQNNLSLELTFNNNNFSTIQPLWLTAVNDQDIQDESGTITHTPSDTSLTARTITVNVDDNDKPELKVSNITTTGATLTMSKFSQFWYYKHTTPTGGSCSPGPARGIDAIDVSGLTSNTSYVFSAYSDEGCRTKIATAKVFGTVPDAPTVTVLKAGSGKLAVKASVTGDNANVSYWQYKQRRGTEAWPPTWTDVSKSENPVIVVRSGLTNNISYSFQVRVATKEGRASLAATSEARWPEPSRLAAIDVKSTTATLSMFEYGGSDLGWSYRRTTPSGGTCQEATKDGAHVQSVDVTGLTGNTDYVFTAYAKPNCAGATLGTTGSFKTAPSKPTKPVVTVVSSDAGGQLRIAASTSGGTGAMTGWQYRYRAVGSSEFLDWQDALGENSAPITSSSLSHVVGGLNNGVRYEFQVRVKNDTVGVNRGGFSPASDTSDAATPSGTNKTLGAGYVTANSARLVFAGSNLPSTWYYKSAGTDCATASSATVNLTGLSGNTSYTYHAYSDSSCSSAFTPAATATFLTRPGQPSDFRVLRHGSGTVTLQAKVSGTGTIVRWEYRTAIRGSYGDWKALLEPNQSVNKQVTGLENTYTQFEVRAVNASGTSASSALVPVIVTKSRAVVSLVGPYSMRLELSDYDMPWWYVYPAQTKLLSGVTRPSDGDCKAAVNGRADFIQVLKSNTKFTFSTYRDPGCTEALDVSDEVTTKPRTPTTPTVTRAGDGQLRLSSSVTGDGDIVEWQYKQKFANGEFGDWITIRRSTGLTLGHTVSGLKNQFLYQFKVRAKNGSGISTESSASVAMSPESEQEATVTLAVSALSSSTADLVILGRTGTWYLKKSRNSCESVSTSDNKTTVTGLSANTSYLYEAYSNATCSTKLDDIRFVTKPGKPTGFAVLKSGSGRVTVRASVSGDGTINKWQYQQKTGTQTSYGAWQDIDSSTGRALDHEITGLTNKTRYRLRVRAVNASGESAASDEMQSTPDVPALAANSVEASTMTLQLTAYDLNWSYKRTTPSGGSCVAVPTGTSKQVSGLSSNTIHQFTAYGGRDCANGRSLATTGQFLTKPGQPSTPVVTRSGSGELTVSSAVTGDGSISQWQYRQKAGANSYGDWVTVNSNSSTLSHKVTGLTNGTSYRFQVRAKNATGDSAPSGESVATSPLDLTGVVFSVNSITASSARLRLSRNGNPFGQTWRYKRTTPAAPDCVSYSGLEAAVSGLTADTQYTYEAYSAGGCTVGERIAQVTFQTRSTTGSKIILSPSELTVYEGQTATYTVHLNEEPSFQIDMAIEGQKGRDPDIALLSNGTGVSRKGLTFTRTNWNKEQTVTVTAKDDRDLKNGSATFKHSVTSRFESMATNFVITEADIDNFALKLSTSEETVTEGMAVQYGIKLSARPSAKVTVTATVSGDRDIQLKVGSLAVARTANLTFSTQDWNTYKSLTISARDDPDALVGSAKIDHTASGGAFGGVPKVSVMVTEAETDTAALTLSTTSLRVPEGKTAAYGVSLATQPSHKVTVTATKEAGGDGDLAIRSSGGAPAGLAYLTFGTGDWSAVQSVVMTAANDGDALDGSATIKFTAFGGDYGRVTGTATAMETDDDTPAIMTPTEVLSVSEGSVVSYEVRLATLPARLVSVRAYVVSGGDSDLNICSSECRNSGLSATLEFTTSNWSTAQTVTVTASEDGDGLDGSATIQHEASSDYAAEKPTVNIIESDNDRALVVSSESLQVTEGTLKSYTVKLKTAPLETVTVTALVDGGDPDIKICVGDCRPTEYGNQKTLSFTSTSWNVAQTVNVTAAHDPDAADGSARIEHSADNGYPAAVKYVLVSEDDDEEASLDFTPSPLTVSENNTATYGISLATPPTGSTTIAAAFAPGGDQDLSFVGSARLTFNASDWSTKKSLTITAAGDADAIDGSATINHTASGVLSDYSGKSLPTFEVTENDASSPSLTLVMAPGSNNKKVPEEGSNYFTVVLDTLPSGPVAVNISKSDGDADINVTGGATLNFTTTNWNTAKSVTLSAADDIDLVEGVATFVAQATGADYGSVSATITVTEGENDIPTIELSLTSGAITVTEGSRATYTVKLGKSPSADVNVSLTQSGDNDIKFTPQSLAFTAANYSDPQSVTLTALEDDDAVSGSSVITHTASGGNYDGVTRVLAVTESDDDSVGLSLSVSEITVTEGSEAPYAVQLVTRPSDTVTVAVTAGSGSDPDLQIASGSSLTYTTENWSTAQSVTLTAVVDSDALDGTATVIHTASGGDYASVSIELSVTEKDTVSTDNEARTKEFLRQTSGLAWAHLMDAIDDRLAAGAGINVNVAGRDIGGSADQGEHLLDGLPEVGGPDAAASARDASLTEDELVDGARFSLGALSDDGYFGSIWVRAAVSSFSSNEGFTLDGDAKSFTLGADYVVGRWLAGLAISRTNSEARYVQGTDRGEMRAGVTGAYPYFRYIASPDLTLHGVLGLGSGEFEIDPATIPAARTDLHVTLASVGMEYRISQRGELAISLRGSGRWINSRIKATNNIPAVSSTSTRLNVGVEASLSSALESGGAWERWAALLARLDGGDGIDGYGLETELGVSWTDEPGRVSLSLAGRGLLAHEVSSVKEWTISATASFDPNPDSPYGFSAKLAPSWGGTPDDEVTTDAFEREAELSSRIALVSAPSVRGEVNYGFPSYGGLATSSVSALGDIGNDTRSVGVGYKLSIARTADYVMDTEVRAGVQNGADDVRPTAGISWQLQW